MTDVPRQVAVTMPGPPDHVRVTASGTGGAAELGDPAECEGCSGLASVSSGVGVGAAGVAESVTLGVGVADGRMVDMATDVDPTWLPALDTTNQMAADARVTVATQAARTLSVGIRLITWP
ncbi:MAG: hypothetical protein WAV45_14625 [Propionibacteriaceae bacterium]|nr:hypothetical protein [Micropruina sp.]HBX82615.1 hypothetical protein [Propionibacteriaceae bacterium]HBY22931.1 hypothetical protein [Propionibacteriaceae bacterium]